MITNLLLGLCGIVLYTILTASFTYAGNGFDWKTMLKNNGFAWVKTLVALFIIVGVMHMSPETLDSLNGVLGFDITSYGGNFFMIGFGLTPLIKALENRYNVTKKEGE